MRNNPAARLLLVAGSLALGLALCELTLRVIGFDFELLQSVQFRWPDPTAISAAYVPDPDLFWVPREYRAWLEGATALRPDVVFMGDSCTEFGTYPRLTLDRLKRSARPDLARGVKLGVGGWSSEQGRAAHR